MKIGYGTWLGEDGLKQFVLAHGLPVQRNDEGDAWYVFACDGPAIHEARILKTDPASEDQTDFETAFSSLTGRNVTPVLDYVNKNTVSPRTSDGKPIYLPNLFPGGVTLYISGSGDGAGYGNGNNLQVSRDTAGSSTVEFGFNDWVYIAGGGCQWKDAAIGDYLSLEAFAPASTVTPNGGGTGNCNLVDPGLGAAVLIVPAAGNGAYDVDLANAVPIPAFDEETGAAAGYWDWSEPDTGKGSITPSAGGSKWHLFAVSIDLGRFVNRYLILGAGAMDITVPAIKPKKILPHWRFRFIVHNEGGNHTVQAVANVTIARMKTL